MNFWQQKYPFANGGSLGVFFMLFPQTTETCRGCWVLLFIVTQPFDNVMCKRCAYCYAQGIDHNNDYCVKDCCHMNFPPSCCQVSGRQQYNYSIRLTKNLYFWWEIVLNARGLTKGRAGAIIQTEKEINVFRKIILPGILVHYYYVRHR